MIVLYSKDENSFISNGIAVLDNALISAKVTEDLTNTDYLNRYYAEYELDADSEEAQLIDKDLIIKSPIPNKNEDLFVVSKIRKDLDTVYVKAIQIFFVMEDNFIEDTNIVDKTGYAALDQMQKNTQYPHKFNFHSDISTVNSARMVRKNFVSALIGNDDNSFVNRWGGELKVNKFDVYMNTTRGEDRGVAIEYRKNLTGLDGIIDYNSEDYYTKVMPEGYDGLFLDEKYVDSPLIDNTRPKIRLVKFDDIKIKGDNDEDGYENETLAKAALKEAAEELFSIEHHDIPPASYEINFVELTDTEEYKDYSCLERIWLGDTVTVKHREVGIDIKARLVKYEFDAIDESYLSLELGNAVSGITDKYKDLSDKIDKDVEEVKTDFQKIYDDAVQELTDMINSGIKGHTYTTENEYMVMDTEDPLTAVNVARFNVNGLGFSTTGINGPYLGLTNNGKLVITEATANKFTAALITTGILKSADGRTCFNLTDGKITLFDLINNAYSLEMYDSSIDLFDRFGTSGDKKNRVAKITSRVLLGTDFPYNIGNSANVRTAAGMYSGYGQAMEIGYMDSSDNFKPCLIIDGIEAANLNQGQRLGFHEDIAIVKGKKIYWYNAAGGFDGSLYFENSIMKHWGSGGHSFIVGQAEHFKITPQGAEVIGTFTDSSDLIYKKNIRKLDTEKDTLQILKDVDIYQYEENGTTEIGLLAQEAVKIIPEIIHGIPYDLTIEEANTLTDAERTEKLKSEKGASVDVYSMLSLLWDANKKMLQKIETLENKINELESRC